MGEPLVTKVRKIKEIALIALAIALLANISGSLANAHNVQHNCRRVNVINQRIRDSIQQSINQANLGAYDNFYQKTYGADWRAEKAKALKRLYNQRHTFNDISCNFPLLFWSD